MLQRGALVILISQTEDDAIELLAKAQCIFDHLPDWMKPTNRRELTRLIKFRDLRSSIVAMPSTRKAGRGRTAKLVVSDEYAQHMWAEANFASIDPTIDAGGQFIVLSTADGIGNMFADLWFKATATTPAILPDKAEAGVSFGRKLRFANPPPDGWMPIFIPYDARPSRDEGWWERKSDTYPQAWMIHQEFPRDPEEAFVQTGRPVFTKELLDRHKALCRNPLPKSQWPGPLQGFDEKQLRIFALPQPHHRYFAGADVAEGLEHGDYSDMAVSDADMPERSPEVLTLHGHWEPDEYARLIDKIARVYPGIYGIERNNHGLAVILECRRLGTPGLYRERPVLTAQGVEIEPGRIGWTTTTTTKPLAIDELSQALREFSIQLSDELAIPELVFYQTNKDGSTGAPSGKFDDRVMSRAIMVQMRKRLPSKPTQESKPVSRPVTAGLMKKDL